MRKESRWAARRSTVLVGELDVREARRALDTGQEGRHKNCVECVVGEAAEDHGIVSGKSDNARRLWAGILQETVTC